MIQFTKRNLFVFFRDRSAVFFSLMASFIIIGLYVLFLGDVWKADLKDVKQAGELMNNWVMAGLLATTSVTTTMGAFGTMVNDKAQKISKDFYSSPIKRNSLAGGYVFSSFIIGFIMSFITFILAEIYIVLEGGSLLSIEAMLKVMVLLILADLTNTAMIFFITTFFESNNAFSTASSIIGTLIGFITGIYLPIGALPEGVQWVIRLFPTSHAAVLLRQTMMEETMKNSFAGVPKEFVNEFKETMGVEFKFGKHNVTSWESVIILLATTAVLFGLAVLNMSRKKKG